MPDLQRILEDSNDMKEKWNMFMAYPYARSYATALMQFREVREAQSKLNAQRAEFGMLALTICSGGILTHVFAQTAWRAVAANAAINIICRNNMERAFRVAHYVSNNAVGKFTIGALWDAGEDLVKRQTKSLFEQNAANFPSAQQWQTETAALTSLMSFVGECYTKYRDAARHIFANRDLNEARRNQAVEMLTNSNFAKAPSGSSINEDRVAKEIELLFHLRVVMDLDYTQTVRTAVRSEGLIEGRRVGIEAMPGTPNYPTSSLRHDGIGGFQGTVIGYRDLGMAFYERINRLHRELYGRPLLSSSNITDIWNASMNQRSFLASHQAIGTLENAGMSRFRQSLN